jgi:hypothetical protein
MKKKESNFEKKMKKKGKLEKKQKKNTMDYYCNPR